MHFKKHKMMAAAEVLGWFSCGGGNRSKPETTKMEEQAIIQSERNHPFKGTKKMSSKITKKIRRHKQPRSKQALQSAAAPGEIPSNGLKPEEVENEALIDWRTKEERLECCVFFC